MLNPYSPLRLSPGLVIDEYGQPKKSIDTPESLPTEPAAIHNLPPNDLNATIDRMAKELEAARAQQKREQQQQQLSKSLKPQAVGERRLNHTNLTVNHSRRAGRSRSRSPERRVPPSKARTVQDPECSASSAQRDARVHETHQAVLRLYNFHRDKSEPASQLHWREDEIGTLRRFARSLRQQQLQEVNVRVLEERIRNLTDKMKPNSKYSLLGRTLGAFGDPAWQTQLQLDQHLRRSPMEIANRPAAKGLPQPHLLSTVETELGRMILSMETALKQTLGYSSAPNRQLQPEEWLEQQHALLDKALAMLKAQIDRAKEAMYFKIRTNWGEDGLIGKEIAQMRRDIEWIKAEFKDASSIKVTKSWR